MKTTFKKIYSYSLNVQKEYEIIATIKKDANILHKISFAFFDPDCMMEVRAFWINFAKLGLAAEAREQSDFCNFFN